MVMWKLYLDDERFPKYDRDSYTICRSVNEAKTIINDKGIPVFISFDHDLGEGVETGHDLAKWLVEQIMDGNLSIPKGFHFNVHSANPVGAKNIKLLLERFLTIGLRGN